MGIRFYCPNGHKLNVKRFQAGLKGICPYCGAKVQIPTESTRRTAKKPRKADALPQAPSPAVATPGGPADDMDLFLAAVESDTAPAPAEAADPAPAATSVPAAPGPPPQQPAKAAHPLVEAGDLVWYVRPASGGQFGPASGDVMRTWIDENRITGQCLVWREGWRDWQEAADVFPELQTGWNPAVLAGNGPGQGPAPPAAASRRRSRRRRPLSQATVIILLVVAAAVLFGVLIWVLSRESGAAKDQPDATAAVQSAVFSAGIS